MKVRYIEMGAGFLRLFIWTFALQFVGHLSFLNMNICDFGIGHLRFTILSVWLR